MRMGLLVLVLALAGCNQAARDAEWKYNQTADYSVRCSAAREVTEAYAKAHDEENYKKWDQKAWGDCFMASRQ